MSEKITLDLPDEVVQRAHTEAERSGRPYEQVLVDWLIRESRRNLESRLAPGVEYPIYTPFDMDEAAQVLKEALRADKAKRNSAK